MLPLRSFGSFTVPLPSGSKLDELLKAIAGRLEDLGFDISELDQERLSFLGLNPRKVLRWPWSFLNWVSGGSVSVRREVGGTRFACSLRFTHFVVFVVVLVAFFGVFGGLLGEAPIWQVVLASLALLTYLAFANALLATWWFKRKLRRFILDNSNRYA